MFFSQEMLESIHDVEKGMLSEIDKVCKQLNVDYYLLGGSMLGAVRHKGFIPWDDDIDIGMLRKDYEKFIEKGQIILPDYYFIQNIYTEPGYLLNFTKLRDSRTTFIESSVKDRKINHGIYLDIFPLDYIPDDKKKKVQIKRKMDLAYRRIYEGFTPIDDRKNEGKEIVKRLLAKTLTLRWRTITEAVKYRESVMKSCESGQYIANYCGAWGEKEIVPAEWYGDGIEAEFEGLKVTIPTHYDKWLSQVYGDYMKLPPEEKRVAHHNVEVIDVNKSYVHYV